MHLVEEVVLDLIDLLLSNLRGNSLSYVLLSVLYLWFVMKPMEDTE